MRHVTLAFLLLTALVLGFITASVSRHASPGDTIVVTSTADDGSGTLRQALLDAHRGDTITFNPAIFPPGAPVTISLTSALPQIHQGNLTLDASDAGVILDGTNVPGVWVAGLDIVSHGNTIQGFHVGSFSGPGIAIGGAYNTIGGDPGVGAGHIGQGNLTSHNDVGIGLWGSHVSSNTIKGNLIGSDATGVVELGNRHGVEISEGANGNVLGPDNVIAHNDVGVLLHQGANGNVIGPDNVIAYNDGAGIDVENPETLHNTITRNSIHENDGMGISLSDGANGNTIGPDNVIAHNGEAGIEVDGFYSVHNTITQNSIHDNDGMGIDLWYGGNGELAAPHITDLDLDAGTVTGTACSSCTVEIFSDGCSEGKVFEGRTTADGPGAFTFTKGVSLLGPHLTATATDADGNTSEFSIDQTFFCRTPSLKGERYEALVPDTLDLQERAELAINALTRCTNPEADYAVYFYADLHRNPPVMSTQEPLMGKFMEGLAMMRMISGSQMNVHVDQRWRELFLGWLTESNPALSGPEGGRQLAWMAINDQLENDPCWREFADQALESISEAVVHEDDYCYFPDGEGGMPTGWQATYQGWTLQGVTQLYLATGSDTARQLAAELARYLKDHAQVFDGDGHFLARHWSKMGPALHFHHNGNALVGISEYALATGDEEFAAFANMGYEWARSLGSPLVGFFPEYIDDWPDERSIIDCETCCVVDMILLALTLSEAGQGDYWDDVDRYVRNQFAENQLRDGEWIDQMAATLPPTPVGPDETADRVSERVVGSFAGWATANDFYGCGEGIMQCCTGNGARALYYVWEKMIELNGGTLSINLLLNRASPWADVDSYIPYEGRVDVRMKQTCNLEIRIPEWVEPEETSCAVDGGPRELTFQGRYAQVGRVEGGSLVTLTFPISERIVEATIGDIPYTLIIKGSDVVSIDPPGEWCPLYQRAHYRENQARWVERERFVLAQRKHLFLPVVLKGHPS